MLFRFLIRFSVVISGFPDFEGKTSEKVCVPVAIRCDLVGVRRPQRYTRANITSKSTVIDSCLSF
jgi:hypothetical protein